MKKIISSSLLALSVMLVSCNSDKPTPDVPAVNDVNISSNVIVADYIGNGPQWGGYDIVPSWTGQSSLSDADWAKIFQRLDYMRPQFIRMMVSAGWTYQDADGSLNLTKSEAILGRMLDYCQSRGITVQFGEWGHQEVGGVIDEDWMDNCAQFLEYLIKDKGYSCIKYFTMVNEPNGDWSSTDGNITLWSEIVQKFYTKVEALGVTSDLSLMGPDVAVWTSDEVPWITAAANNLGNEIGAFDIHVYPNENDVRETSFSTLLNIYRAATDKSKVIVLGELGLKYDQKGALGRENAERINADKYAADDSQMFVYDAIYGIDVADATVQTMRAGYAGSIVWMLDDAMYNDDGSSHSTKLKRWGFWNILGEEKFESAEDENIRPWFYPMSLMCRYFPAGSQIHEVTMPSEVKRGLRVVAGQKGGKYTVAIVNNATSAHTFTLTGSSVGTLSGVSEYRFISGDGANFTGEVDANGFPVATKTNQTLDLAEGHEVTIEPKAFVMLTNIVIE